MTDCIFSSQSDGALIGRFSGALRSSALPTMRLNASGVTIA
jgi:hypothetical protein